MAPANTDNDNNNNRAVTKIDQTNNGTLSIVMPGTLIFLIVVIKFMASNTEEIPAKCTIYITKSTEPPECAVIPDKGGYTVHLVPAPKQKLEIKLKLEARLLIRGQTNFQTSYH